MDFTEIYPQTASLVHFSPGNQFLLTAKDDKLIIRRAETLQITHLWEPPPESTTNISHIGWSCDSEHVFAAYAKNSFVKVYQLADDHWSATIHAGVEGLANVVWAPDGRTILCFSEWNLRVTIWSLTTGTAAYIQYPSSIESWSFRADGRYFILAERIKSKDAIGVYDAEQSFKLVKHFPTPTTSLASMTLSPSGTQIVICENALEYHVYVLSLSGRVLGSFSPPNDPGLGIRCVQWHPGGTFLALGGWDSKVYVLETVAWTVIHVADLQTRPAQDVAVWQEPKDWLTSNRNLGFYQCESLVLAALRDIDDTADEPGKSASIPQPRLEAGKSHRKCGISLLEWNINGTLLAIRLENYPETVFIMEIPAPPHPFKPRLRSLLLHNSPVTSVRWNPVRPGSLVMSCSSNGVYTWSDHDEWESEEGQVEEMAECGSIPSEDFRARDIRWSPDGKGLVLLDKSSFCCAYEVSDD